MSTIGVVPYRRIDDVITLRRFLDVVLMIEADVELSELLHRLVKASAARG